MSGFAEVRFETGYIIYGTSGGVEYSTDVVVLNSGYENRNQNWQEARGAWNFGDRKLPKEELDEIINFFRCRRGKAIGFRFKDWSDFSADGRGVFVDTPAGWQMAKQYSSGGETELRIIRKPVASTIHVFSDGAPVSFTLDSTTGIVTTAATGTLTWEGEFDVPVRFDTDKLDARFDSALMDAPGVPRQLFFYLSQLPLVEIRQ